MERRRDRGIYVLKTKIRIASKTMRTTIATTEPVSRKRKTGDNPSQPRPLPRRHVVSRRIALTVILRLLRKPIQSLPRPAQVPLRPIKRHVRLIQQALMHLELVPNLQTQVVLPADRVRQLG